MKNIFAKKYLVYWVLGIISAISLGVSLVLVLDNPDSLDEEQTAEVTDFDSCVEVTGIVLESFPEQCVHEGITYTNPRQSIDGDSLFDNTLPRDEERQILTWMEENNLNEYGDPQGTVYAGGTPLFSETEGTYISLYDYLLENHPTKPWMIVSDTPAEDNQSTDVKVEDPSTTTYIFSDIEDWLVYEDPKFQLDYPGEPIGIQVADANGYPVRMYSFDGFEVFLGIDKNPKPEFECTEKAFIGGTLFFCHNEDSRFLSVYEYMIESIVVR